MRLIRLTLALGCACCGFAAQARPAAAEPIAIADVKHEGDVDFGKEILPIFRRNCLACHSATEAQSDLVLETPQTVLKGGSNGPAVVAGKSAESLLLKLAAMQEEPHMPPPDNDVQAKPLTPEELGLIKLWIDQGAKGEVASSLAEINWQPLPPGINPIYAIAITPDGQYAAAARANQVFLFHVPSKRELGRLTDPALIERGIYKQPGVADLDLVQSLAFSPDGRFLASGGFRTVKLWEKPAATKQLDLAGFESPPRSLAVSADGKLAAIGEENGKVRVFDLASGQIVKTLEGHSGPVTGVAFTADATKLVTGSQDKALRVWNVGEQKQLASLETPAAVNAVALVADGKQVASGGEDNVIRLWDLPESQPAEAAKPAKELAGHGGPVTSLVAVDPAGSQLLSGSKDGTLRVWDIAAGNAVKSMNHGTPIEAVAVRADGKRFASVSSANHAKLWNAENGQQVAELKGDIQATLQVAHLTREVSLAKKHIDLAKKDLEEANKRKTAEEENEKKAKEALTKAETEFKPKDEAAKKATAEKEAAEKAVADASAAKTKAEEGQKAAEEGLAKADEAIQRAKTVQDFIAKVAAEAEGESKKAADEAKAAADKVFADAQAARQAADAAKTAAGKAVTDSEAVVKQADEKLKALMPGYQKAIDELTAAKRTLDTAKRGVERAAEAVKKAVEAIPGYEAIVKQREEAAKKREEELTAAQATAKASEQPLHSASFSPDGRLLVTVGNDQKFHTWDSETGAAIEAQSVADAPLAAVAFAADGKAVVAAANKTAGIWHFASEWRLVRTIGSPDDAAQLVDRVTALDFSPDGKLLAVGSGEPSRSGQIKLFSAEDGKLVRELKEPHSDTVNCLRFSPDGQQLASGAADRFVKVWNVGDGAFVRSFEGHTHHVLGVAWRADGRMLVSSGADNVLKVWDTRTGDQLRTVQNLFNKEVTSVTFVADGESVVACGGDSRVRMINTSNGGNQRDFPGVADYMYATATSADGKTILAGGLDGVLRIWNDQGQEQVQFTPPKQSPEQTAAK